MYYPKSQIKTNLYTNGDKLYIQGQQTPYIGYYWKTSQNKFYTGKTPNSERNLLLIPFYNDLSSGEGNNTIPIDGLGNTVESIITINEAGIGDSDPTYNFSENLRNETMVMQYENIKPKSLKNGRIIPQYYKTLPTPETQGQYLRYFAKQNNSPIFIEISKETFNKFSSKDLTVASDLYTCLYLNWSIEENSVLINRQKIKKIEKENKWYGFYNYFKGKFDDSESTFDSLYTNGGEFLFPNRTRLHRLLPLYA